MLEKVEGEVLGESVEAVVPIIPVFGGTAVNGFCPEEGSGVYPKYMAYGVGSIPVSTMNREFWWKLVPASVWRSSLTLQVELGRLAGHMRMVEWFVGSVLKDARGNPPMNWDAAVAKGQASTTWTSAAVQDGLAHAEGEAKTAFDSWLQHRNRPQLIAAVVLGVVVPRESSLDGVTVDDIVKFAPVVVQCEGGRTARLLMSPMALRVMCGAPAQKEFQPFTDAVRALLDAVYGTTSTLELGFEAFENLCALQLAVQKMGYWVLGMSVTCGHVFRGAVFVGRSELIQFSKPESRSRRAARLSNLGSIQVIHALRRFPEAPIVDISSRDSMAVAGVGHVFVNAKGAPFADVASRLLSNVDEFLALKRYVDSYFDVPLVVKEVRKVCKRLDQWRGVAPGGAGSVVVFISLGHYTGGKGDSDGRRRDALIADVGRAAADFLLPTVVVCRGCGLEELFGPLLEAVALRCRE
jgi:hypothetical protein